MGSIRFIIVYNTIFSRTAIMTPKEQKVLRKFSQNTGDDLVYNSNIVMGKDG